jgi:RHS repeat-associated protein
LQLTSITLKAGNKLNPIIFKWKDENYNITPTTSESLTVDGGGQILTGDFNGDGRSDILSISLNYKTLNIYLKNAGSGFSTSPISKTFSQSMSYFTGDFNGDGRTDILLYSATNKTIYWCKSNIDGSLANEEALLTLTNFIQYPNFFILDNNGDGLSDLIAIDNVTNSYGYNNFQCFYAQYQNNKLSLVDKGSTQYGSLIKGYPVATGDFDGDGMMDLVTNYQDSLKIFMSDRTYCFFKSYDSNLNPNNTIFADFNGDGCTDIFDGASIYFSKGKRGNTFNNFFIKQSVNYDQTIYNDTPVGDINGDGKADIMDGYLTIGFRKFAKISTNYFSDYKNLSCDINGDGIPEILSYNNPASSPTVYLDITSYFSTSQRGQLISAIRDGMGVVTKIEYDDISNNSVYTRQSNANYPVTDLSTGMQVVSKVTLEDGTGGSRVTTYQYAGGKVHRLGRGFLGFNKIKTTDSKTGIINETTYEYENTKYFTAIKSNVTKQSNGSILSSITYTNSLKSLFGGKVYEFTPNNVTSSTFDLQGNQTDNNVTTYTYDSYGNTTVIKSSKGTTGSTTTNFTITNDVTNWWLGKVTSKAVIYSRYGSNSITRNYSYTYYDNDHLLKSEVSQPNDPKYSVEKQYIYTSYGNLSKITVIAGGKNLITEQRYENGPEWPSKIINPAGYETLLSYQSKFGVVIKKVEVDSTVTINGYDEFGQLLTQTDPFGTTTYDYKWATTFPDHAPSNAVFVIRSKNPTGEYIFEYFDKYGRSLRKAAPDINGNYIYTDTEYDNLGRVKRKSEPYKKGTSPLWTSFTYNLLGQVISTGFPDGSISSVSYSGLNTTATNVNGQTETRTYDLMGLLISVTDFYGGVTQYSYDAMGNMVSVTDPSGNVTSMSYDIYGNRILLNDKDLGSTTDDYNALGQLITSTNAKNYTTSYIYDNLGRVKTRTEKDAQTGTDVITTYVYDGSSKFTYGKILSENNSTHSKTYSYFSNGLLKGISENIDNQNYTTSYTYDSYGRICKIDYPRGFSVKQSYQYGYLYKITSLGGDTTYYTCNDMTPGGQVSKYQLGVNLTVNNTYDVNTGFLTQTTAGNIQSMHYEYDALGNLTSRTNQKRNLNETFTYDGLNRLTSSNVYNNGISVHSVNVHYNSIGNITFKSDVGTYQYDASRPHAVLHIVNPLEDYQSLDYDVEYTSFDKVYRISNATQNIVFTYGTDQQRIKAVSTKNGQTTTKLYIGKIYEKETLPNGEIKENFYIFANNENIAIYTRSNSGNTRLVYCLHDHLGSLMYLVSPSGSVVEEYAYDAWGRRRDVTTWLPFKGTAATARGFTGHEHIDLFELVNMNGRIYDPRLGRFLSPDPYVQALGNSQSFNRYSYCLNNPLKYTDPSGYTWWSHFWGWSKENKQAVVTTVTIVVAVTVTVATAGMASPLLAAAIVGASAGFAGGALGAALDGKNFGQVILAGFGQAAIGAVAGMAGFGVGKWAAQLGKQGLLALGVGYSPIGYGAVCGMLGGMGGGFAGSFTGGFIGSLANGGSLKDAWNAGLKSGVSGLEMGGAIGTVTGVMGGIKYAKENNLDAWTGNKLSSDYNLPVGRSGNPMDARGTNQPTTINGRTYTGHALDQMQGRGMVPSVVENAINNPITVIPGNTPGTIVYFGEGVKVITNLNGDVVTVIPQ